MATFQNCDQPDQGILLNRIAFYLAIGLFGLYFLPFGLLLDQAYFTIHDNLDSEFVYLHLLVRTGQAFNFSPDAVIENVMNGLPRSALLSGLNVAVLWCYLFEPPMAYIVNHFVIHLVGFVGMVLLLKTHFIREKQFRYMVWLVALLFACVEYYVPYGLSVAGQPLLLYAFLNLLNHTHRIRDYIIIVLFPFYSFFPFTTPFVITFLIILAFVDALAHKRLNRPFAFGIAILAGSSVFTENQVIYAMLIDKNYVSHRTAYNISERISLTLLSSVQDAFSLLLRTHRHTGVFPTVLIMATSIYALTSRRTERTTFVTAIFIFAAILTICLIHGLNRWLVYWIGNDLPVLKEFQIHRFYFLLPLLWFLLFSLSLRVVAVRHHAIVVLILISGQLMLILKDSPEWQRNVQLAYGQQIDKPTYRQFFATQLFSDIDHYIGKPKSSYRIVSIGLRPAVAQFNGFYTLDSYQSIYELDYKHAFRRIIKGELARSANLRSYFDGWGSRCYILSHELGKRFDYGKHESKELNELTLNSKALKDMGGVYVFSAVKINNHQENGLTFERHFSDDESYWDIYLYQVD